MDGDKDIKDSDFIVKKLILEQACYFCQHRIIQRFMPEDITTYNIHPLLPAMAAIHSLVCSYHSDHETGKAVTLLQYIHSLIPQPSPQLQQEFTDLLISLKTKASLYEIFTQDHSSSDNQYHMNILDKYFGRDGEPQYVCGEDGYSVQAHSTMRQTIKGILDSEKDKKNFQLNVLLQNTKSKGMHEGLADNLETYLNQVRRTLPTPQLVANYLQSDSGADSSTDAGNLSPCGKKRVNVVLKKPQILLQRLVKAPTSDHTISPVTSHYSQLEKSSQSIGGKVSAIESPTTPRACETPALVGAQEAGIKKLDPKENRVMGSIARKRKFLAGSPTTSSDDSSCSFLSLKKMRRARSSFMSPEIPLASATELGQNVSKSGGSNYSETARFTSGNTKSERKKRSSLLVHRKKKTELQSKNLNLPRSVLPSPTSSGGIVRCVSRKEPGKQMVHFAEESDYVSESDCESPLSKNTPLCDLGGTSRRTC